MPDNATRSPLRASADRHADRDTIVALAANGERYPIDKLEAHVNDVRHLAVSVFLFAGGRLLLQRRAAGKYHSGALWANTCCSHPRWRETPLACAQRRLYEELGCRAPLRAFGRIDYTADVGPAPPALGLPTIRLRENESVHCFFAHVDAAELTLSPDPEEVSETDWLDLDGLAIDVVTRPTRYAAWLRLYVNDHLALLRAGAQAQAG